MANTKIVCTIGPASRNEKTIFAMVKAGMSAARINTAHGDFEDYQKTIKLVRSVADIPIILDIKGPELRLRNHETTTVKRGVEYTIGFSKKYDLFFNAPVYNDIQKGDVVLIQDGLLEAKVIRKQRGVLIVKFNREFVLKDNRNCAIPNRDLSLKPLSKKDKKAIQFAIAHNVEYIALSYTRNKQDVLRVDKLLKSSGTDIIAKIENPEGIQKIDEIIEASAGIMVARGDMGVELPLAKVPMVQKEIIKKCNRAGKLVITATQMLESMIENERPTRAEVSDVANAILDGSDAIMLSGETAIGEFPIQAVKVMSAIADEVEPRIKCKIKNETSHDISDAITRSVHELVLTMHIDTIITMTLSGYTARMMSRFRTPKKIIAVTPNPMVKRQLELYYAVEPVLYILPTSNRSISVSKYLIKQKLISKKRCYCILSRIIYHTVKCK